MYIYQPQRILLRKQIKKYSHYIKGRVLDVGAGSYSRYLDLFDCQEYVKMDISPGKNVDIVGRAENIPFEAETFDAVVCTQVLEHLAEPQKAVNEIYRVLKKGGYCLLSAPQINELHGEPHDYFRYTKFGLVEIFSRQDFQILECDQVGGFFTMINQLLIRYLIDKLNLYQRRWGRLCNPPFKIFSKLMTFLDRIDKSKANRKHTLIWCLIAKK